MVSIVIDLFNSFSIMFLVFPFANMKIGSDSAMTQELKKNIRKKLDIM